MMNNQVENMKPRFLRSKRGEDPAPTSQMVIIFLLLGVAVVLFVAVIPAIAKTTKNVGEKFTQCGDISIGQTGRCMAATGDCIDKISGEALGCKAGQVCCFDPFQPASAEEAKAFFKTNFKTELEACRDDVTKCDQATERLISIVSAVNAEGQGQIFVIMKKTSTSSTVFALAERTKTFTSPKRVDEFSYAGDTCAMIRLKGKEPEQDYYNPFELGTGRSNQGELVVFKVGSTDPSIGTLESVRHKKADDTTSPLCLVYAQK